MKIHDEIFIEEGNGMAISQDGYYAYKFGIIDYLGTFNTKKKSEIMLKTTFKNAKKH